VILVAKGGLLIPNPSNFTEMQICTVNPKVPIQRDELVALVSKNGSRVTFVWYDGQDHYCWWGVPNPDARNNVSLEITRVTMCSPGFNVQCSIPAKKLGDLFKDKVSTYY